MQLVSFVAVESFHTHRERKGMRDIGILIAAFRNSVGQRTVNINNHNGVKFRCQIIETILNALQATIYSTTILLIDTQREYFVNRNHLAHISR